MEVTFFDMIGAAAVATVLAGYGLFYVFEIALARGERAGIFAGIGLSLGLLIFASFPLAKTALQLAQMTQYFQYVRIIIVILAIVFAIFVFIDYQSRAIGEKAGGWTLFRVALLGVLLHLITPLPFTMYDQMLDSSGLLEAAGQLANMIIGGENNPFSKALQNFTLPVVSFFIYWVVAIIGGSLQERLDRNETWRTWLKFAFAFVWIGAGTYVAINGMTYDLTLVDKVTNFGINRFLQQ